MVSKRFNAAQEKVELETFYPLADAIKLVKENATAKFDETVEIAIKLGIDPRNSEQMVRGVIGMPKGLGKAIRVAVFAKGDKTEEAKKAGADIVGDEDLVDQIKKGTIEFERCIATPDMMAVVSNVAKILGPRGLMPNPKLGTVTMDVGNAVKNAKSGEAEFRAEKGGIIHAGIGKASFSESDLAENISAFVTALKQAKPSGVKGTYFRTASLSSTMGPGVAVDIATLVN